MLNSSRLASIVARETQAVSLLLSLGKLNVSLLLSLGKLNVSLLLSLGKLNVSLLLSLDGILNFCTRE
ncbi:hypothetical protein [Leptospira borgpetersenii]|uniref:hypothetical protein n=1 Tax=Leptospira borgpetersenii TaxID=174 RepID=UPI0012DB62C3|nr:hypothetical protein [Leptospira borgpetersenii]